MELEQSFTLAVPPGLAWPAFGDLALLVSCLPGARLTGPADADGLWPLRMDVRLGPIAAAFAGRGQLHLEPEARRGRFEGSAADQRSPSRVKGQAQFALLPEGSGSRVTVQVAYTLTGPLAQFSRGGLVRELAGALTAQFAERLQAALAVRAAEEGAARTQPPPSTTGVPEADGTAGAAMPGTEPGESTAREPIASRERPEPPVPASAPEAVTALDGFALLRQVIKARWLRLMSWLRGRHRA